jgi:hypothetical protein
MVQRATGPHQIRQQSPNLGHPSQPQNQPPASWNKADADGIEPNSYGPIHYVHGCVPATHPQLIRYRPIRLRVFPGLL